MKHTPRGDKGEREARARLIAAGEKDIDTILHERELLLAACKALVELVKEGGDCLVPEIVQAEAAIAKAEQRTA